MKEKILSINEDSWKESENNCVNYDGYIITTERQIIKIGIYNGQCCCEDWGYFMSEDNFVDFIGAYLTNITTTDTELNTEDFNKEMEGICMEECSTMFVNFETSNGTLQFVAYNSHNGYYGHDAKIISNQLNGSETL